MSKTHAERVEICINRLQEAGVIDSSRSDIGLKFKDFFSKKTDPEAITKNILYIHSKGFNFNAPEIQKQLLVDNAIEALQNRELFFKAGFESKIGVWRMAKCPALNQFWEDNLNKDQSSSMYFALQTLESNGCFSTPTEAVSLKLKELAIKTLAELENSPSKYRVREADETFKENSIELLPERVVANFVALIKEGYAGIFAQYGGGTMWGGVSNGLTEKMIRVLANPLNEKEFAFIAMDFAFSAMSSGLSSRRDENENELASLANFIDCWSRVLLKIKFMNLVSMDNNDQWGAFLRSNTLTLTPDMLRASFSRLPEVPSSEINRKLILLQQGELDKTESAIATDAETNLVARNMEVALKNNRAPAVAVSWTEALRDIPLNRFSSDSIAQRTRLLAISKLQPEEARKALGLEHLNALEQATLIAALIENKHVIYGDLNYLTGLLKKSTTAKQGDLLIDYFFGDISRTKSGDLKKILGLTQWLRYNESAIKGENKNKVEQYIDDCVRLCVISMSSKSYSQFKPNDQIRLAWKNARSTSEKTEAEQVYRAVQKLRKETPVDVKAVSQVLSDYMTKSSSTAFSVELRKLFGDFFIQFTPSRAVAEQATNVTTATASFSKK